MHPETRVVHSGHAADPQTGATVAPVVQSSAYAYPDGEQIADTFDGRAPGYIYSRIANPTSASLERRLAELEDGVGCITCSSGMAAVSTTVMGLTRAGDHVVAARGIFGGTVSLLTRTLGRFGIETTLVDAADAAATAAAVRPRTRLIFVETITNPGMDVPDLPRIAEVAHGAGIPLVVDSTVTTPFLVKPGSLGADIVIHSLSKFINGHGNSIGGAIIDTGCFDWSRSHDEDIAALAQRAGRLAFLAHLRTMVYRDLGCCPSPLNSFLHTLGLDGLAARMEIHCRNAASLAAYLSGHPNVAWVNYPGLPSSPGHETACRLFGAKYGGILTFGLGSREAAMRVMGSLSLATIATNVGDSRTLVIHPASTIFHEFSPQEREAMGVSEDMVRVSVGVEHEDDILADFESALGCMGGTRCRSQSMASPRRQPTTAP